ncbi:MAG: aminotransferase class III-fold pyridoxal phosphate-dependent enzyme [Eubacteriaceae bacterium]|nr:aminotransferase class III-fold pyridoxal phosphate-dependent enzyme [Eubacteriaceae bacterium]
MSETTLFGEILELDQNYVMQTYDRFALALKGGKGSLLYGEDGNTYIDLGAGIAVNIFGVADLEWIQSVTAQLGLISHTSNLYYNLPQLKLAELMCQVSGFSKVFFCNSGTEANEGAIKAARKYSSSKYLGESRFEIVTLRNSFHGRSYGALSATGQESLQEGLGPMLPGFSYIDAGDLDAFKKIADSGKCCAIMLEVIQGEGGLNVLDSDFVKGVGEIAKEHDILVIIDEVQTGNGRTGKMFGYEHFEIAPDIITTAKGIGGGLPFGAILFAETAKDSLTPGSHGSTFGGNAAVASGVISIYNRLTPELMEEVAKKGEYLMSELSGAPGVESVSGMGLMVGVKPKYRPANEVVKSMMSKRVLAILAKDKIRLLPALNIPMELLEQAVEVLKEELAVES